MSYKTLQGFLQNKMRMSHIYQPVMIKALLQGHGKLNAQQIARNLLNYDISQIEYYSDITNNMVGRVLRSHDIVHKEKDKYSLVDFAGLKEAEIKELVEVCDNKIDEFLRKRGDKIWKHRMISNAYISGSIRYEVFKRAKFRCELCGISAEERALTVDHIEPRKQGGENSINNYQALCYVCNSMKRDKDNTDFRKKIDYEFRKADCIFCNKEDFELLTQNNLAIAFYDNFPVTKFHTLIIPKRHTPTYFELTQAEINAISQLVKTSKESILNKDNTITGFNIGINDGETAGQTIFHTHVHLIPRRINDIPNPKGGVRNIIPGKGNY